jgi:hypothetical protein
MLRHFPFILGLLLFAACATPHNSRKFADDPAAPTEYASTFAIGPGVPTGGDDKFQIAPVGQGTELAPGGGPSRVNGGENFNYRITDQNKKPVNLLVKAIRLIGYSKSGQGKVVIHNATGLPAAAPDLFKPLYEYTSQTGVENQGGNVALTQGQSIMVDFGAGVNFDELNFTFEDFGNSDASIAVQVITLNTLDGLRMETLRKVINTSSPIHHGGGGGGGGHSPGGSGGGGPVIHGGGCGYGSCTMNGDCCSMNCGPDGQCREPGGNCTMGNCSRNGDCCSLNCGMDGTCKD